MIAFCIEKRLMDSLVLVSKDYSATHSERLKVLCSELPWLSLASLLECVLCELEMRLLQFASSPNCYERALSVIK